jgi:hypothetical protein
MTVKLIRSVCEGCEHTAQDEMRRPRVSAYCKRGRDRAGSIDVWRRCGSHCSRARVIIEHDQTRTRERSRDTVRIQYLMEISVATYVSE